MVGVAGAHIYHRSQRHSYLCHHFSHIPPFSHTPSLLHNITHQHNSLPTPPGPSTRMAPRSTPSHSHSHSPIHRHLTHSLTHSLTYPPLFPLQGRGCGWLRAAPTPPRPPPFDLPHRTAPHMPARAHATPSHRGSGRQAALCGAGAQCPSAVAVRWVGCLCWVIEGGDGGW